MPPPAKTAHLAWPRNYVTELMVDFCYIVLDRIKAAAGQADVKKAVEDATAELSVKKNNSFKSNRVFVMNMTMILKSQGTEGLTSIAGSNIQYAIAMLEDLRKKNHHAIF